MRGKKKPGLRFSLILCATFHLCKKENKNVCLCVRCWITADPEVILLHWTHFVLRDGQLGRWVTVVGGIVGLLGCGSRHGDVGCDGRHLSSLTLRRHPRTIRGLVHVAVWNGPHASEMLE